MNRRPAAALGLGALMLIGTAGAASAQSAPSVAETAESATPDAGAPIARPHKTISLRVSVVVDNKRSVELTELDATPEGGASAKQIVANLAPGKKTVVKIARGKSCVFDLHGAFEDGSSTHVASVNLCKDGAVNLID